MSVRYFLSSSLFGTQSLESNVYFHFKHLPVQTRPIPSAQDHMWLVATVPDNIGLEASFWNPQPFGTVPSLQNIWILKASKGIFNSFSL